MIGIDCYDCDDDSQCNDPFDKNSNNARTKTSSDGWCWVRHDRC
jgi:hypothetical protein